MPSTQYILALLPCVLLAQASSLRISIVNGEGTSHAPGAQASRPLTVQITDETGRPVAGAAVSFHFSKQGPGGVFANGLPTDLAVTDRNGNAIVRSFQLNRTPGELTIRITAAKEGVRAGRVVKMRIGEPGTTNAARAQQNVEPEAESAKAPMGVPVEKPAGKSAVAVPATSKAQPDTKPPAIPANTVTPETKPAQLPTVIIHDKHSRPTSLPPVTVSRKSRKKWVLLGILAASGAAGAFAGKSVTAGINGRVIPPASVSSVSIGAPTITIGKP